MPKHNTLGFPQRIKLIDFMESRGGQTYVWGHTLPVIAGEASATLGFHVTASNVRAMVQAKDWTTRRPQPDTSDRNAAAAEAALLLMSALDIAGQHPDLVRRLRGGTESDHS